MSQISAPASEDKTIGIIAYLTLIGLLIAFVMNIDKKHPFARFHTQQSLGLFCTALALFVLGWIPILGWLLSIAGSLVLFILWLSGIINALNGRQQPVWLIGNLYTKWFSGI